MRIIRLYICTSIFLLSIIGQVFCPEPFLNKNWIKVKDRQKQDVIILWIERAIQPSSAEVSQNCCLQLLNHFEKRQGCDVGEHEGLELPSLQSIMR